MQLGDFMKKIENIYYTNNNSDAQTLNIYLPESDSFKVFLYFHGGGFESGRKEAAENFVEDLISANIAVVSADYRMYPYARYPEFIIDGAAAVAWVKKNISEYGNCEALYVGGSSAGGYLTQMLCFDKRYLAPFKLSPMDIDGFIHDAGQPTTHFNVLRERGIDSRRVIIDEAAPLYHIGKDEKYPPMLFLASDNDWPARLEQTHLIMATLKHFGYPMDNIKLSVQHGTHCHYVKKAEEGKENVFAKLCKEFMEVK